MGPDAAQVRPSACKWEPRDAYPATFAWCPHEIHKTFEKVTSYLYWPPQILHSLIHQRLGEEKWKRKMQQLCSIRAVLNNLLFYKHFTKSASKQQKEGSNSWLHCFLLQFQLTIQVGPNWWAKQAVNLLLPAAVFSRVSMVILFAFPLIASASAFYFIFLNG